MAIIQDPIVHLEPVHSVLVECWGATRQHSITRENGDDEQGSRSRSSRFNIFQRLAHRPKFMRLRTTATQIRSLTWRHLTKDTQRRHHHRPTRHRLYMQLRFIRRRQSTWCQLLSMSRLLSTERPWFRVQYMRTRQGIGVATGVAGTVMATGMAGGTKRVGKKRARPR